jgi:hypothetical protein
MPVDLSGHVHRGGSVVNFAAHRNALHDTLLPSLPIQTSLQQGLNLRVDIDADFPVKGIHVVEMSKNCAQTHVGTQRYLLCSR